MSHRENVSHCLNVKMGEFVALIFQAHLFNRLRQNGLRNQKQYLRKF